MLIWCSDYWSVSEQKILCLYRDHFYHRNREKGEMPRCSVDSLEWNYRRIEVRFVCYLIRFPFWEGWRWCVVAHVLFWLIYQSVMSRWKKECRLCRRDWENEWCAFVLSQHIKSHELQSERSSSNRNCNSFCKLCIRNEGEFLWSALLFSPGAKCDETRWVQVGEKSNTA